VSRSGRSFGANVLISFAFTGLLTAMALGNSVIIARMVGAEGRGLYALAVAALGILSPLTNLGLGFSSTWALGRGEAPTKVVSLNHAWSALMLLTCTGLVAPALFYFEGVPAAEWALIAVATLAALPASVYTENVRGVFLGRNQIIRYNSVQTGVVLVQLIANLTLLQYGRRAVLLAWLIAYWLPSIIILLGHVPALRRFAFPERAFREEQVGYGVRAAGTHLLDMLLFRLDYLLVTPIVGVAAIGLYSVADQIVAVLGWGGQVAGRMMLAESSADVDGVSARRKLGLGVRTLILVVGFALVGAAATGWLVIPAVFGEDFRGAYLGMLILLPGALLRGASSMLGTYLMGRAVLRPVLIAGAAAIVIVVVGSPIAAMTSGWLGVAAVRVVAMTVQLALVVRAYREVTGESMRWVLDKDDVSALAAWVRSRVPGGGRRGP